MYQTFLSVHRKIQAAPLTKDAETNCRRTPAATSTPRKKRKIEELDLSDDDIGPDDPTYEPSDISRDISMDASADRYVIGKPYCVNKADFFIS